MVIKNTYNLIYKLINRITFYRFKKCKFLFIVDNDEERYPINDTEYLNIRKIYFFYILKSLLKSNIKNSYLKKIHKDTQFKIVISNNLNIFAYRFKKVIPNIKYFIYQHSYIYDYEINSFKNLYSNIIVDKFFVLDQKHKKIFSSFLKSKYYEIGSFKNNFINLKNQIKIFNQVNYISEYRGDSHLKTHIETEKYIVKLIDNYCKKMKFKFLISLNSNRKDKYINKKNEINFFNKISKRYIYNDESSYQNSLNSIVTFSMSSNIGVELWSRKIPLIYFDILHLKDKKFKNPYNTSSSIFFINKIMNLSEFTNYMRKLMVTSKKKEIQINKNFMPFPIKIDIGNTIFLKKLANI